jgi:hypothetical protein
LLGAHVRFDPLQQELHGVSNTVCVVSHE